MTECFAMTVNSSDCPAIWNVNHWPTWEYWFWHSGSHDWYLDLRNWQTQTCQFSTSQFCGYCTTLSTHVCVRMCTHFVVIISFFKNCVTAKPEMHHKYKIAKTSEDKWAGVCHNLQRKQWGLTTWWGVALKLTSDSKWSFLRCIWMSRSCIADPCHLTW